MIILKQHWDYDFERTITLNHVHYYPILLTNVLKYATCQKIAEDRVLPVERTAIIKQTSCKLTNVHRFQKSSQIEKEFMDLEKVCKVKNIEFEKKSLNLHQKKSIKFKNKIH